MKIILSLLMCFTMTSVVYAQAVSGNRIVDGMLEVADEIEREGERLLEEIGVKSEIDICFDQEKNELVYYYCFFSEQVYDSFDLEAGKKGAVNGMITEVLKADESGEALEMIVGEFKRTKTNIRLKVAYGNQVKSSVATSLEIQRLASLLY